MLDLEETQLEVLAMREDCKGFSTIANDDALSLVITAEYLIDELTALRAENERLKRGEFTPDELQQLCHNLFRVILHGVLRRLRCLPAEAIREVPHG